jgi:hypothetical protein
MGSEYEVLPYQHRLLLTFKRTGLEALVQSEGRSSTFSERKRKPLLEHFEIKDSIHGLTYVADIFKRMNEINLSVQGPQVTIMEATETLQAVNMEDESRGQHPCKLPNPRVSDLPRWS